MLFRSAPAGPFRPRPPSHPSFQQCSRTRCKGCSPRSTARNHVQFLPNPHLQHHLQPSQKKVLPHEQLPAHAWGPAAVQSWQQCLEPRAGQMTKAAAWRGPRGHLLLFPAPAARAIQSPWHLGPVAAAGAAPWAPCNQLQPGGAVTDVGVAAVRAPHRHVQQPAVAAGGVAPVRHPSLPGTAQGWCCSGGNTVHILPAVAPCCSSW